MSCAKYFSPILSHTFIVVVQWPKFGHCITLNNKCYKAHKEMEHLSSIDVVKEYSKSSAERQLGVDDRPEETVSNSLILINNIMYYA